MTDPTQPKPISVTASPTKVVSKETVKMLAAAGFAVLAYQFIRSELVLAAVLPIGGFLGAWAYGLIDRWHTWRCAQHLANQLPDEKAVVGHVK
jgi:hypothetical protein